ncbi:hypothetical protein [Streptomyces sp. ST2-7A]|uniref:hypothetical protein n=1 Tax=Streptomyces sp. ST2-7A TaxID=2907214 RepID=UPI001F3401AC|nr:hypothetical protein [Streptomyces sp. ST2-7A]MCE7081858.1 hypothetical protein [Streptomyces sp. ST2-7A]
MRLRPDEVAALETVLVTLEPASVSDALREGLRRPAREAEEIKAAREIRGFYGEGGAPLPDGVTAPTDEELRAVDEMEW